MQRGAVQRPVDTWAGADGEWLRHYSWEPVLAELREPGMGRVALERLREEFPPQWSLDATEHPVRMDWWFLTHRMALIEIGHVLATVRCRRVRKRLRDPKGYLGVRAELRAGVLLLGSGAELAHEPFPPGGSTKGSERSSGPDWRATWPDGMVHVEVKLSRTSVRAHLREGWSSVIMGAFNQAIPDDVRNGPSTWATLRLSDELLDDMGDDLNATEVAKGRARNAAAIFAMMQRLQSGIRRAGGTFTLLPGLDVLVRPRRDGAPGLALDGSFAVSDAHRIALRLRTQLQEAAAQLEPMPGRRVILLDTSNDSALYEPLRVVRALVDEPWAAEKQIAAIMLVHRRYPHCLVQLIRGPASDSRETLRLLTSKLRTCERGHLHGEAMTAPTRCSEL